MIFGFIFLYGNIILTRKVSSRQTHPKPNSDKSKSHCYLFTNLPPVPRTYTDDFWRRGDDDCRFSNRDIEALNQFRQLELELLESDDEKESKIREFVRSIAMLLFH
ncbi:hypothetical protein RclHR1_23210003 [Rhizophagus clarus]|uniref:Uncharacterized protein n=1 Tax=Rhizophagus clarus TaxID=94130 RepID=A0A2Z6R8X8_9GLOM|nr:hypothetical protein RclHR1_23210003 [Rhizophagus clarus]